MKYFDRLDREVCSWPDVSTRAHRFGGKEFRLKTAELGHIHAGGIVDIPFPRSVRDALLASGLAEKHRWVPDSGWITFQIRSVEDVPQAIWLMRISYLRYALKSAGNPGLMLDEYSEQLKLTPQLKSLLEEFVPRTAAV